MIEKLNLKRLLDRKKLPAYEPPRIVSYSDEELLSVLGPAQAGNSLADTGVMNMFLFEEEEEEENPWALE
jgi:hypothetical protein